MLEIKQGAHKTRIWLDELPDWAYEAQEYIHLSYDKPELLANTRHVTEEQCAAVEQFVARGGHFLYSGLGATFLPAKTGSLEIEISGVNASGRPYPNSLAIGSSKTSVGLPSEYIPIVRSAVMHAETITRLGPGLLRFAWAIQNDAGSSQRIYFELTLFVIRLLGQEKQSLLTTDALIHLLGKDALYAQQFFSQRTKEM